MKLLDGFRLRPLAGEYIVMGETPERIDFSRVVSLNATAAYLWEQVQDRDFTPEDLVALLTARYDVTEEQARADVDKLLASWREAGLIEE
jgi:Ribonuclease G/E